MEVRNARLRIATGKIFWRFIDFTPAPNTGTGNFFRDWLNLLQNALPQIRSAQGASLPPFAKRGNEGDFQKLLDRRAIGKSPLAPLFQRGELAAKERKIDNGPRFRKFESV